MELNKESRRAVLKDIGAICDKHCIMAPAWAKKAVQQRTLLHGNPFDLDYFDRALGISRKRWLIGSVSSTSLSVSAMVEIIKKCISEKNVRSKMPNRMRIIQVYSGSINKYNFFFEVVFDQESFLCGGCTDYSGTGRRGKNMLEEVFVFLHDAYGIPLDRVMLSRYKIEEVRKVFDVM